jgi:cellulose synthase operon protein C
MSEDKPRVELGEPDEPDDDVLRRASREIRASKSLEAFVPLSASEREQLADAAIARALGIEPSSAAISSAPPASTPAASAPAPSAPASAAPRRSRFRARYVVAAASTLALAAVVALYVGGGRRPVEALVAYSMVVEGEQRARGTEPGGLDEPVVLRPETRLVITLATAKPERDALLRLLIVRGGRATLLDPPLARRAAGTLVIEGPAADLLGVQTDGSVELVVVLGRELPGDDEVRALALRTSADAPRHLQVLRRAVVLEGFAHTAIDVLLGGCSAVLGPRGAAGAVRPTCEVAVGARLRLWVDAPLPAAVAVYVDGRAVAHRPEERDGGTAFGFESAAGLLSVRIADRELAAWDIAPVRSFERVSAASAALGADKVGEAAALLDAIPGDAPPEERLDVMRGRAAIAFTRGDAVEERAQREQAIALARSLGRTSVEIDQTIAILYGLRNQHEVAQAVQLLPALDAHGTIYAEGAVRRDGVRGLFASELGDLGAALGAFQRALTVADRIADAADRAVLVAPLADVLQSLGRGGEVLALVDAEIQRADSADPCTRVEALTSAGWLLRDRDPRKAQRLVDQAAELAAQSCERRVPVALVNQGWLLAAGRRFGDARAVLDRLARVRARDARVTTWTLRLEAEIFLGEDPARAERHGAHLAARAAALCSSELAYEAHLLRARALAARDRPAQAAAAFAEAERALTLWSRTVPLGEGRDTFFDRHDQLALTAIPFFLDRARRGAPGAHLALATTLRHGIARFVASLASAGRERARALRGEQARDRTSRQFERTLERWPGHPEIPELHRSAVAGVCEARDAAARDEQPSALAPPSPALFVHPAPHALLVLAWRGSSIDVRELPRVQPGERDDELSARIATAAAAMLAGAPRVRLYVHRSLAALPLDRSLAALLAVPIAFAVDAQSRATSSSCRGAPRALLVANPQRNLWAASNAVPVIRSDLLRMGFQVDTLEGAAATRAALEARLVDPCTALFQYDGHAAQRAAGRTGGLRGDRIDDALLLAGGDTLTAADVLALRRVPGKVVLNGCTTAAPEGLGLAQAFLLAGAQQVIASLDELPADDAAAFSTRLFEGAPSGTRVDLVGVFARAMAGTDVRGLRAFER